MLIRFLLTIHTLMAGVCFAAEFDTSVYYDQNQHSSFHAFGNDGSHITSDCSWYRSMSDGRCYFNFEDGDRNRYNILVNYKDLPEIHPKLLTNLKALRDEWKKNHPVNFFNQFLFAQEDHDYLDSMIEKLEKENLPLRVLFPRKSRDVEQFWSNELMRRVMEVYTETLRPYDNRFKQDEETESEESSSEESSAQY